MADNRVVAEIVSEFFLRSCQPRRRLNMNAVAVIQMSLSLVRVDDSEPYDLIPLSTGSIAEFYIEPMLSCVGDADIMFHRSSQLAIPQGHPPPTQLPDEFHGRVSVAEIIDSGFPGYVYLVWSYLLTETTDDGKYNAVQHRAHGFMREHDGKTRGPARLIVINRPGEIPSVLETVVSVPGSMLSSDLVPCTRCLSWPLQAADWPTRHRNYGWPDSATVDRVVSSGCDVVEVAHRLLRQDELGKYQWRLSFSRAEIVLINSWTKVQQIVYHMLRFFMKTEGLGKIRDNAGNKIVSNYNIKTLILWACEMKGRSWWIGDLNVVGICVKLLHILADWLTDARCPHYFINSCNLFDSPDHLQLTQNTVHILQSVTEADL